MAQQKAVEAPVENMDDLVDELQPGTKLLKGQYTITRYLNSGGFGITYLAKDSLDRDVVIKECFPSSLCRRSKAVIAARSRAHSAELRSVVQLFVKEARHLSKIVHPNIVAVHQVFEDNGTAYMAIDFIDGLDLQQVIEGQGPIPDAEDIVLMTEKLLAAVGFIHANDMLHRDISPDNILVDKKGEPILIDFGAAREQASKKSRAMSALRVVKDGYSPQEFYIAGSEQGPWSDLYALAATLYHLITGEAPVNGQARLAALAEDKADPFLPLNGRFEGYPPNFLAAIDKALATLPRQRVQSAQEWLSMFRPGVVLPLSGTDDIMAAVRAMVVNSRIEATPPAPKPVAGPATPAALAASVAPAASAAAAPAAPATFGAPPQFARQVSQTPVPADAPVLEELSVRRGPGTVQAMAGVAFALALIGIAVMLIGGGEEAPAPTASETAPPPAAIASVAATAPEPVVPAPAPEPEPAAAPVVTATPDVEVEVAVEPPAPAPVVEAPVEVAPETVAEAPAPASPLAAAMPNQIAFAAWDAEMPFLDENRIIGGQRLSVVARILPSTDVAEAGDWLAPGLVLHSVNGVDIQQSGSVTTAVLNAMKVDPDGKARVVVEYSGPSQERQTGLMTVAATRLVSLASGVNVGLSTVDGQWQALVTGVTVPSVTQLRQGDILFRDKTTGVALNGPTTLEAVMKTLADSGALATEFSIIRDNKLATATMQLAVGDGQ